MRALRHFYLQKQGTKIIMAQINRLGESSFLVEL